MSGLYADLEPLPQFVPLNQIIENPFKSIEGIKHPMVNAKPFYPNSGSFELKQPAPSVTPPIPFGKESTDLEQPAFPLSSDVDYYLKMSMTEYLTEEEKLPPANIFPSQQMIQSVKTMLFKAA